MLSTARHLLFLFKKKQILRSAQDGMIGFFQRARQTKDLRMREPSQMDLLMACAGPELMVEKERLYASESC